MDANKFLKDLLKAHEVAPDSKEMKALEEERAKVEKLINAEYADTKPTIKFGGSKAKGTMILESYDLDLPVYFANGDRKDESLHDIYKSMAKCLEKEYHVEQKRSALRLKKKGKQNEHEDFRIDVVPGRYTDDTKTDSYLYVNDQSEKERLKTNLQTHVDHVKDSGFLGEIRLLKLWKVRNNIEVKTFILELLTIKILSDDKYNETFEKNLKHIWTKIRDGIDDITLEDPANPSGNDLSKIFTSSMKADLKAAAKSALKKVEQEDGWYAVFGEAKLESQKSYASAYVSPNDVRSKPWRAWW
ncbi:hypothetical protein ACNQKP_02530 [Bdellovibrio bacteriovorus]|uniref:hypothetical protein n=1 Tax=Bdellovibrio bacteriovorus TaxID=959 RepID=UPI003AA955DB